MTTPAGSTPAPDGPAPVGPTPPPDDCWAWGAGSAGIWARTGCRRWCNAANGMASAMMVVRLMMVKSCSRCGASTVNTTPAVSPR